MENDLRHPRNSITSNSSRDWISRHTLALKRYLRRNHKLKDRPHVFDLLYYSFPDEGKKLILNDGISNKLKIEMLIKWIFYSAQVTFLALGDQRMGKDASLCKIFELIILFCKESKLLPPRIVTLGNVRRPPFVDEKDMFFSFKDIPFGTKFQSVYIYSSELESEFPAREFASSENKLFSILEGTLAQNHQKLFGCVKLTSKVDLSVLRSCNVKLFKYITPEKLDIEGVERVNVLSDLGRWFLPRDVLDKRKCLLVFNNNLLTCDLDLPNFWTDEYSEQFRGGSISRDKIYDFVKSKFEESDKLTPTQIHNLQIMVYQKFRQDISKKEIFDCFSLDT